MDEDIERRILTQFEVRLRNEPDVSSHTMDVLLSADAGQTFGDDDDLLDDLVQHDAD